MRTIKFLLCVLLLALSTVVYGQDPYYTTINKSGGLPSNSIYALFQDNKGFMWIASNEGITRYDGFEFRTYTSAEQTSRAGNGIKEDKYGRIWYRNFDGYLYYVENDSLKSLKHTNTIGNVGYAIMEDHLFLLSKDGLDIYDLRTMKSVKNISIDLTTMSFEMQYKDCYFITTLHCLYKISADGSVEKIITPCSGMISGAKNGILIASKTKEGKYHLEACNKNASARLATTDITFIHGMDYCSGLYWLFTPTGAWVYDEQGKNINNNTPLFASKNISCVIKDRDDNFWMGTLDEGILFVPDINTKLISQPELIPNVLAPIGTTVYAGTKNNRVFAYDLRTGKTKNMYKGDVRHEIISLVADTINNRFYFAAEAFIVCDNKFTILRKDPNAVKDITLIDDKYIGIAASGITGLLRNREDISSQWDSLFMSTEVPGKNECDVMASSRGRTIVYNTFSNTIYASSNTGLYAITPNIVTEIKKDSRPIFAKTLATSGNNVYILTAQNKIYSADKSNQLKTILVATDQEQLLNIKSTNGRLYLMTSSGLKVLDTASQKFMSVNIHPGIRSEEINDLDLVNGQLIIASDRGLILIDNTADKDDTQKPGFTINAVLSNGNKSSADKLMHLSHTENDIDINYSILSFNTARRYHLRYRINNGKWQPASITTRNLKLASLSPGAYDISFQLADDLGKIYPQPIISFIIRKPFWMEWWFAGGCFILVSATGYSYYKWQTNLLKKKNALTLEKVELEKNLRNSMLTSIRAQMNPHFFYNALNTIQSFIFADDKRNASTYLVKLSRLTRTILEMSDKESVTLDEETAALQLYLELEKMRFSSNFNYSIYTNTDVDSEMVKIPPMIVQPYVENAIKHGLLHKKGEKELSITFKKDNGNLSITIDDNGIGREKAGDLQAIKKDKHHPFSTDANSKRIDLLNKERSKNIGVLYIDKKDENNLAAGTTVIISIPLI